MEKIVSYKGFDKDFKCLDMQYEVGKTYTMDGKIEACSRGYHACKEAKHVFRYYPPSKSRYAVVEQSGILSTHKTDSKVASSSITVVRELSLQEFLSIIITQQGEGESAACSTGDYGAASSTGYYGAASSTGYYGAASSTGEYGAASSTGDRGAASSTGRHGAASSTGDYGAASSTGHYGAASSTGHYGAASSTGHYGAASSTGDYGAASSTGDYGAASSTGEYGAASSTGYCGKVMGSLGNALFLVERTPSGEISFAWAGIVGESGIKPNVWYSLKNGVPTEV